MAQLPKIEGPNRLKPLSYDPRTKHFVTYDDVLNGQARLVPLDELSPQELKKLVIERNRVGPDYKVSDLSGRMLNRDQVIEEIVKGTDYGKMLVEAEVSYLKEFNQQVRQALESKRPQ